MEIVVCSNIAADILLHDDDDEDEGLTFLCAYVHYRMIQMHFLTSYFVCFNQLAFVTVLLQRYCFISFDNS